MSSSFFICLGFFFFLDIIKHRKREDLQLLPSKSEPCLRHSDLKHKLNTQSLRQASPIIICIQSANEWQLSVVFTIRAAVLM